MASADAASARIPLGRSAPGGADADPTDGNLASGELAEGGLAIRDLARGDWASEDRITRRWLMLMGGATLLALATPTAWVTFSPVRPSHISDATLAWWWLVFAIFTAAWGVMARRDRPRGLALGLMAVQSATALIANWLIPTVFAGVAIGGLLLMMVAAMLAVLPSALAFSWIGAQSLGLLLIYLASRWGPQIAFTAAGAYAAGQLAMLGIGRMAERQRRLREALAETVAELLSTRALLEESARSSERARIARELHDLLGHHLVAMRLQLEAAALETPLAPEARRRIMEAASLARLLLSDVRAAVSDMREGASVDLVAALRILAENAPGPSIELNIDPQFEAGDASRVAAFLRCAQEAVTNARRHAGARSIRISLAGDALTVLDDGGGIGAAPPGGGLRGMQERVSALGGSLHVAQVAPGPGGGTLVRVRIPQRLDSAVPLHSSSESPAAPPPQEPLR